MNMEQLKEKILKSSDPDEVNEALYIITERQSELYKQRNDQAGLVDETYINSEIAKLKQLDYLGKSRLPSLINKSNKHFYKFYRTAKKHLDSNIFNEIENKIKY